MQLRTLAAAVLSLAHSVTAQSDDAFGYANRQLPWSPDNATIARNFPVPEGIELLSPAFLNPEGVQAGFENNTATPTAQLDQDHFLRTLAARNDWMNYITPDFTSEEGRSYPYVYLTSDKGHKTGNSSKVRVLIEAHIHGNEPASEEGALSFLGKMDGNSTWAESVLDKVDIMVIPRVNPDGVAYFQRQLATGYDPNRDFAIMTRQQTRDLIGLYTKFAPHIFLDCHEFGGSTLYGPNATLIRSSDVEVAAMSPQNVHPAIQNLEHQLFVQDMYAAMRRNGLRTSTYFTGGANSSLQLTEAAPHAQYALVHNALRQTVAILTESRGIRLGDQHFQRRVAGQLVCITQLVQTAVDNAEYVLETIENAREEFINSSDEIIVTASSREENITWEFIDTTRNGSLVQVPVVFQNFTPPEANLTRSRPEAYVFTRAWHDVAERLRISGVEIEELQYAFTGEVQALKVETSTLARTRFEGVVHNTVTTSNYTRTVTIPAGGFWVSTRQVNAAIAISFLEPEDVASAVTYNVIPLSVDEESPVYRVMTTGEGS